MPAHSALASQWNISYGLQWCTMANGNGKQSSESHNVANSPKRLCVMVNLIERRNIQTQHSIALNPIHSICLEHYRLLKCSSVRVLRCSLCVYECKLG